MNIEDIKQEQKALRKRLKALEEENTTLKEALAIHENRLNNLNIPMESVNAIGVQTLRMLGQMLLAVTEPQKQAEPQAETQEVTETSKEAVS